MIGCCVIALLGIAIDQVLLVSMNNKVLASSLLRFYWFRMSDIMIPCGVTFGVLGLIFHYEKIPRFFPKAAAWVIAFCIFTGVCWDLNNVYQSYLADPRPRADQQLLPLDPDVPELTFQVHDEWMTVCEWAKEETDPSSRFIAPRQFQTFKWYADRSEVVNWKDVPQDAPGIVEWSTRFKTVHPKVSPMGNFQHTNETLERIAKKYDAHYVIVTRNEAIRRSWRMPIPYKRVFPNSNPNERIFWVFEIRKPVSNVKPVVEGDPN